jgi:hypothetical protein
MIQFPFIRRADKTEGCSALYLLSAGLRTNSPGLFSNTLYPTGFPLKKNTVEYKGIKLFFHLE